jgi:polyisoprenyl-teichoic acid--peptidoglycan teichoic acid transferase
MNKLKQLRKEHFKLIIIVVAVGITIFFSMTSPIARAVRNSEPINGMLIGTDWVDYARHSDTLVFVNYEPADRFLNIVSIPRDTHFSPAGYHFYRINEVYAYNYKMKKNDHFACRQVSLAVEELFQNRVSIPYYVQINYEGFKKFIDLIGGIDVEIEEPMNYDDNAQTLHIHFEPGKQHLNGAQALEYVRFRGKSGDIGRVFRQQRFLKSVLSRFRNPMLVMRIPQFAGILLKEVKTNLSPWDIFVCMTELKDINANNIRLAQLPGTPHRELWLVDYENCSGLFDKIFCSTSTAAAVQEPKPRIEVWNASGKPKLAEKVTWILRQQGFDVISYGTFSTRQKKTLIKDLTGDLRGAQKIADIISCGEVVTRFDEKRYMDISVTLGEDCNIKNDRRVAQ